MAHYKGAGQRKQFQLLLELESEMKALALILFSTLLSCCYSQNSVFSPPEGGTTIRMYQVDITLTCVRAEMQGQEFRRQEVLYTREALRSWRG